MPRQYYVNIKWRHIIKYANVTNYIFIKRPSFHETNKCWMRYFHIHCSMEHFLRTCRNDISLDLEAVKREIEKSMEKYNHSLKFLKEFCTRDHTGITSTWSKFSIKWQSRTSKPWEKWFSTTPVQLKGQTKDKHVGVFKKKNFDRVRQLHLESGRIWPSVSPTCPTQPSPAKDEPRMHCYWLDLTLKTQQATWSRFPGCPCHLQKIRKLLWPSIFATRHSHKAATRLLLPACRHLPKIWLRNPCVSTLLTWHKAASKKLSVTDGNQAWSTSNQLRYLPKNRQYFSDSTRSMCQCFSSNLFSMHLWHRATSIKYNM